MEVSKRQRPKHTHTRGNPEGDSIVKKQKYKVSGPHGTDYDVDATDFGASPVKRRKQHG